MGQPVSFERISNVRDLGTIAVENGQHIRSGILLRGGQMSFATDTDKAKLAEQGVGLVIDFRTIEEREEKPDPQIAGAANLHLPIFEDVRTGITRGSKGNASIEALLAGGKMTPSDVGRQMEGMYRQFVVDSFANSQYARFVDELIISLEAGRAVYWHCTAGKDRAGFAAAIVLELLGVNREAIVADYLQSNELLVDEVDAIIGMFADKLPLGTDPQALRCFLLADERYLRAAYTAADELYGSFSAFLRDALGVDDAKCRTLKALCLV